MIDTISCKYCGSANIVKYGKHDEIQYLWCKDCQRKFALNDALPGMRTPTHQIASAVQLFYEGSSINDIRKHLRQTYNNYPSESTVYEWITKFTKEAIAKTKHNKLDLGDTFVCDETVLDIGGKQLWYWDILDVKTRYLVASHLSEKRMVNDVITLMKATVANAGKLPKVIITDRLNSYKEGIKLSFGDKVQHVQAYKFESEPNNNIIERMQGTIKERTNVMRGLKQYDTAKLIMEGFRIHYNYFRPHEYLSTSKDNYVTPAEKANVQIPYDTWLGLITSNQPETTASPFFARQVEIPDIVLTKEQLKRKYERERKIIVRAKQREIMPGVARIR
jgi:putative transposase